MVIRKINNEKHFSCSWSIWMALLGLFVLGCDSGDSGNTVNSGGKRCSLLKQTLTSEVFEDGALTKDYLNFAKGCGFEIFVFDGSSRLAHRSTNWRLVTENGFPLLEPEHWVVFVEDLVVAATKSDGGSEDFEIRAEDKFLCDTHSFGFDRESLKKNGQKNSLEDSVHILLDVQEYYLSFCEHGPTVKIHVENDTGIQVDASLYYNTYLEEKDDFFSRSDTLLFLSSSAVHDGFTVAIPTSRLTGDTPFSFGFYAAGSSTFVNGECRKLWIKGSVGSLTPESEPITLKWELGGIREVEDKFCVGVRPDAVSEVHGVVMYN